MCPVRYPGRALAGRAHREPHMSGQLLRVHRLCCFSDHKPKYTGCGLRSHTIYFNSLCFGPLWHSSISSCFWSFSLVFPLTTFLGPSGRLCPDLWACCVLQLWPRLGRSLRILLSPDPCPPPFPGGTLSTRVSVSGPPLSSPSPFFILAPSRVTIFCY